VLKVLALPLRSEQGVVAPLDFLQIRELREVKIRDGS